jgi:hypothetical protein
MFYVTTSIADLFSEFMPPQPAGACVEWAALSWLPARAAGVIADAINTFAAREGASCAGGYFLVMSATLTIAIAGGTLLHVLIRDLQTRHRARRASSRDRRLHVHWAPSLHTSQMQSSNTDDFGSRLPTSQDHDEHADRNTWPVLKRGQFHRRGRRLTTIQF